MRVTKPICVNLLLSKLKQKIDRWQEMLYNVIKWVNIK